MPVRTGAIRSVRVLLPTIPEPAGTEGCNYTRDAHGNRNTLNRRCVGAFMGTVAAGERPAGRGMGSEAVRAIAISIGLACLWRSGCGGRSVESYRILGDPAKPVLVPPGVRKLHGNKKTIVVRKSVREPDCASRDQGIRVKVRRDAVKVAIRQETLEASPPSWLSRLADILSDRGCLPHDGRSVFVMRALEAFPLGVGDIYRIPYGHSSISDFIDIVAGQRLRVVGPVLRDDSEPLELTVESVDPDGGRGLNLRVRSSANLAGYEETWYSITGAGNGDSRIKHDQTSFFRDGEITVLERPDVTAVSFIPQGRFIRMIYLARVAERGDHDVLFVSGPTREELETRAAAVLKNPSQCLEANSNGWCRGAPATLAINLFVMVVLNGTAKDVAPGIAIGQFLRRGFGPRAMITPSGLEVYRPYADRLAEVEFDPLSGAIMTLPLLGGERILLPARHRE